MNSCNAIGPLINFSYVGSRASEAVVHCGYVRETVAVHIGNVVNGPWFLLQSVAV